MARWCALAAAAFAALAPGAAGAGALPELQQLLYLAEGNRLRRFDVDTFASPPPSQDVLIQSGAQGGRDVNGPVCLLPDGSGRFLMGEDTGQPHPKEGWGVFLADGTQVGKLTATYFNPQGEPHGCAFTPEGLLFTSEVGAQSFGVSTGQLILWFPPFDRFPGPPGAYPNTDAASTHFCKIAVNLPTPSAVATDEDGNVYVAATGSGSVFRFSPPFPTGPDAAGGCGRSDALGSPLADVDRVHREVFIRNTAAAGTPSGLARLPNRHWYVSSVLTGEIAEFDSDGNLVRMILDLPPGAFLEGLPLATGHPQSIAVDARGTLYYADLDLVGDWVSPSPGPDGKLRRIVFDDQGNPQAPEVLRSGYAFPDGVALVAGNFEPGEWRHYAGNRRRTFFNPNESIVTAANAGQLVERWAFRTDAIVTASPTVAVVDVPGEGEIQVVFFQSWDHHAYAVRLSDGSLLWKVLLEDQPGASFPNAASVDVSEIDGVDRVFLGAGEMLYSLDAATGQEIWRFTAGTGCRGGNGQPPGLCSFAGERNEIESSALVAGDRVFVGMDVNDVETGKGGFFAVDARDGRLAWWFDLETGATCRPNSGEDIRRFDGYHSELELGLPAGFLATRPGCNFDRAPTGCGNVWSSAAWDEVRGLLYVASSNCDTDTDPATNRPPPPMPPYDEALFALDYDGNPAWVWRPREVDNDDLAFGAAPNLFAAEIGGVEREMVGIGNKDGTYYAIDRDGVNGQSGVAWNDADPSGLPYWKRKVVPGGDIGGIIATAAVDEQRGRVFFTTGPGFDPVAPQQPTAHALDTATGAIVWNNAGPPFDDASFGPTSAIPGVVFGGKVIGSVLRAWNADTGQQLLARIVNFENVLLSAVASGAAVVDGTVLVGAGIGTRTSTGSQASDLAADTDAALTALCVPGTMGCAACANGQDDDGDGKLDAADPGCASAADVSEVPDCEDGLDNDHDGHVDWPADPGCRNRLPRASESPACSDGVDNDGDEAVDLLDPQCSAPWGESEGQAPRPACGLLGIESLLPLFLLRRRGHSCLRGRSCLRGASLAIVAALILLANGAAAALLPIGLSVGATVRVGDLPVFSFAPAPTLGLLDLAAGTLALPAGAVAFTGATISLSTTALFGTDQLTLTASNAAGTFSFGGAAGGACGFPTGGACVQGAGFGGPLGFGGLLRVPGLTSVALSPVGVGGAAGSAVRIFGAPWTTRTAAVTTSASTGTLFTRMGSGPAAPAPPLVLVTPILVTSRLGAQLPIFVELEIRAVPEPAALVAAAICAAAGCAASARRRRAR